VKTFPNFPIGCKTASKRPPTFPFWYPVSQLEIEEEAMATAAPTDWNVIYRNTYDYPWKELMPESHELEAAEGQCMNIRIVLGYELLLNTELRS